MECTDGRISCTRDYRRPTGALTRSLQAACRASPGPLRNRCVLELHQVANNAANRKLSERREATVNVTDARFSQSEKRKWGGLEEPDRKLRHYQMLTWRQK